MRIRGNAPQVYEKYLGLARDATSSGDRVAAESYYQFAEHYFRIINDTTDPQRQSPQPPPQQQRPQGEQAYAGQEQPQVDWPGGETVNGKASGPANGEGKPPVAATSMPAGQGDGDGAAEQERRPRNARTRGPGRRRATNGAADAAPREAAQPSDENAGGTDSDTDAAAASDDETVTG